VIEDAREVARESIQLVGLQPDMGQCCGVAHVIGREAHGTGV